MLLPSFSGPSIVSLKSSLTLQCIDPPTSNSKKTIISLRLNDFASNAISLNKTRSNLWIWKIIPYLFCCFPDFVFLQNSETTSRMRLLNVASCTDKSKTFACGIWDACRYLRCRRFPMPALASQWSVTNFIKTASLWGPALSSWKIGV